MRTAIYVLTAGWLVAAGVPAVACTNFQNCAYEQDMAGAGISSSPGVSNRPNPLGGFDFSNGITSRANPQGGYDFSNGVTCRRNPFGGLDCQ
jgi:hypothetical protein